MSDGGEMMIESEREPSYTNPMKSAIYPLTLDKVLHADVKATATATGLSQAETMRQAMKHGLPRVKTKLSSPAAKRSLFDSLRSLGPVKLKAR